MTQASTIHPLNPGDKLGAFTIQSRIGAGGSSMVYSAADELLNRRVAIKQLLPQVDDAAFRQRFRQEAQLQRRASESHPGLVQLIDTIEEERGVFLVMEFVEGQTLEDILMRTGNPIDATQTLRIVWSVAKALQAIHAAGVLHRDLKPSNLIIQAPVPGEKKYPIKIADMGVATLIAEQEAMSLGSVRYMSPELLNAEPADARADIYSLGLIFYEMLIGRSGFQDVFKAVLKDERSQAVRWMKWHTNMRAHAPRADEVNERLPQTLGELVARAMAKDPNDRYASAQVLADTIERHFTAQGAATRLDEHAQIHQQGRAVANAAGDTARLPQKKKIPKAVWWLAGSAAVTAVMIGVGLAVMAGPDKEARIAQEQAMVAGAAAFQEGRWVDAATAYGVVVDMPEEQRVSKMLPAAEAGLWAAQAKQALLEDDIDTASAALVSLRRSQVAEPGVVDAISSELSRKRLLSRYETQINTALDANRLGDARDAIDELYRQGVQFTDEENKLINGLNARQVALQTRVQLEHDMAEVDRLTTRGLVAEAMARLRRMEARYAETVVAERIAGLLRDQRYEQGLADGQARLDAADLPGAIRAFAQALENQPEDDALKSRLSELRVREAVERGQRYLAEDRADAARDAFAEALGYGESEAAMQALGRLDAQDQQQAMQRQGDMAMAEAAFDQAVNAYQAAVDLGGGSDAQLKLDRARVALYTSQADTALAEGRLDQAGGLFDQALRIDPGHGPAVNGAEEVTRGSAYKTFVAEGDDALKVQRFGDALRAYRRARDQINTEQVRAKIDDAEFAQLIALARGALSSKDYSSAKAYLVTARRSKPSPVIDELMVLANKGADEGEQ